MNHSDLRNSFNVRMTSYETAYCDSCSSSRLKTIYMFTLRLRDDSGEMDAIVFAEDAEYFLSEIYDNLALFWNKFLLAIQARTVTGSIFLKSYVVNLDDKHVPRYRIFNTKLIYADAII
jgi:hypothetical protein